MNILTKTNIFGSLTRLIRTYHSTTQQPLSPQKFNLLSEQYQQSNNVSIFNDLLQNSTHITQHVNYFRIFRLMEQHPYNLSNYQHFASQLDNSVKDKTDNLKMLLARARLRIARNYEENNMLEEAKNILDKALQGLQECLIPPALLYYQVYMFYGIVLGRLGENDKAKEALTESLEIIDEFTKNSGDRPYLNNEEILTRIRACNYLVKMDSSTRWLQELDLTWKDYTGNRQDRKEYVETVLVKLTAMYAKINPTASKEQLEETLWEIKVYVKGEVKKFTNSDYKETILEAEKKLGTMIR